MQWYHQNHAPNPPRRGEKKQEQGEGESREERGGTQGAQANPATRDGEPTQLGERHYATRLAERQRKDESSRGKGGEDRRTTPYRQAVVEQTTNVYHEILNELHG